MLIKFQMKKETNSTLNPIIISSSIVALALILSVVIGSYVAYLIKNDGNVIAVTGSYKKTVDSDLVRWNFSISEEVTLAGVKDGYKKMATDLDTIKSFLASNNIADSEITIDSVGMSEVWDSSNTNTLPKKYTLSQNITVSSWDVKKITDVSKLTGDLINKGVIVSTTLPTYSYTKLPELRISLLSDAIKDAQKRAQEIVKSTGQSIGSLKSASSGVVQVLPENSVDVSDYGYYDTSSIRKDVMLTVKATFGIR